MQTPPYLKTGDEIRIISTARKISLEELQPAIKRVESWGMKISFGKNLFREDHQFAGTRKERIADLQDALDSESVKAILCARGGYGSVQLIDSIDFQKFQEKPKWLIGYSDVTVLHCHINQIFCIETLHANMPINFSPFQQADPSAETIRKALSGETLSYDFEAEKASVLNFEDSLQAPIFGGNLSILYSLSGSVSQLKKAGHFIFMEDLDEYLYHIDRMMMNLRRSGLFENCKGILVGGMSDMNDNTIPYGRTAKEIILENTIDLDVPVVFGVPAGHIKLNKALIMGREVRLMKEGKNIKMVFNGGA
ncbi:MAG: LD-carboxypeptidase [Vicingaceae bacterium]